MYLSAFLIFLICFYHPASSREYISFYGNEWISNTIDDWGRDDKNLYRPMVFYIWTQKLNTDVLSIEYHLNETAKVTVLSTIEDGELQIQLADQNGNTIHNECNHAKKGENGEYELKFSIKEDHALEISAKPNITCAVIDIGWETHDRNKKLSYEIGVASPQRNRNFVGCISAVTKYSLYKKDEYIYESDMYADDFQNVNAEFNGNLKKGCDPVFKGSTLFFTNHQSTVVINGKIDSSKDFQHLLALSCHRINKVGALFHVNFYPYYVTASIEALNEKAGIRINSNIPGSFKTILRKLTLHDFKLTMTYTKGKIIAKINQHAYKYTVKDKLNQTQNQGLEITLGKFKTEDSLIGILKDIEVFGERFIVGKHAKSAHRVKNYNIPKILPCLKSVILPKFYQSRDLSIIFECWECTHPGCSAVEMSSIDLRDEKISKEISFKTNFVNVHDVNNYVWVRTLNTSQEHWNIGISGLSLGVKSNLRYKRVYGAIHDNKHDNGFKEIVVEMFIKLSRMKFNIIFPHGTKIKMADFQLLPFDRNIIDIDYNGVPDQDIRDNLKINVKQIKPIAGERFPAGLKEAAIRDKIFIKARWITFGDIVDRKFSYYPPFSLHKKERKYYFVESLMKLNVEYHGSIIKRDIELAFLPAERNISVLEKSVIKASYQTTIKIDSGVINTEEFDYFGNPVNTMFIMRKTPQFGILRLNGKGLGDKFQVFNKTHLDNNSLEYVQTSLSTEGSDTFHIDCFNSIFKGSLFSINPFPEDKRIVVEVKIKKTRGRVKTIYLSNSDTYYTFSQRDITFDPPIPNFDPYFSISYYAKHGRNMFGTFYYDSLNVSQPLTSRFKLSDLKSKRISYKIRNNIISDPQMFVENFNLEITDSVSKSYYGDRLIVEAHIIIDKSRLSPTKVSNLLTIQDSLNLTRKTSTTVPKRYQTLFLVKPNDLIIPSDSMFADYDLQYRIIRQPFFGGFVYDSYGELQKYHETLFDLKYQPSKIVWQNLEFTNENVNQRKIFYVYPKKFLLKSTQTITISVRAISKSNSEEVATFVKDLNVNIANE